MNNENVCKLRRRIQAVIKKQGNDPEAAALMICVILEDQFGGSGNGWYETNTGDDEAVFDAIEEFYNLPDSERPY